MDMLRHLPTFLLVGIDAIVIHGNTVNGSHAWNYVKIDNVWYLIDITFDDPGEDQQPIVSRDANLAMNGIPLCKV